MALMSDCTHESGEGIDKVPSTDPRKVWRCDACGWLHRFEPVGDGTERMVDAEGERR
jgi:hypothetical protein